MKRILVKNVSSFFLIRYISSSLLCFLTLFVTGRLGDIDFLLGNIEYGAGGTTSNFAREIFSNFSFIGNRYLIISLIASISSLILFILLQSFIDKKNINSWIFFLMAPGLLIYSNSVTKETLFLYPAIIFIILECSYLTRKDLKLLNYASNFFLRIIILGVMIATRGDLSLPYIILFFLNIIIKNVYFGNIFKNLEFNSLLIKSFFISIIATFIIIFFKEDYFSRTISYLESSFRYENIFRPSINAQFIRNPLNYFYIQYLSAFPTPLELINKPYKMIIIIDSLILYFSFIRAWKSLFKVVNSYTHTRQITAILFSFVVVIYFSLYGIIGSFNLGSSQRLRINYIPLGIIFPLILEKMIREKKLFRKPHL